MIDDRLFQEMSDLFWSISPDMKLTKQFFRDVYRFDQACPGQGVADVFMQHLEYHGCTQARQYYNKVTGGVADARTTGRAGRNQAAR